MNFKELDELIHSGAKEIVLNSDVILEDSEEEQYLDGILLDEEIIIDGNNHVIDAKCKTRIFDVEKNLITIKNTVFKNGNTTSFGSGGAIKNRGKLAIENSRFENCYSPWRGGALANIEGILFILNSQFINNNAFEGGAVYNESDKFGVFTGSKVTIDECLFKDNSAKYNAGAIHNTGVLAVRKSKFENNSAKEHGGVIFSLEMSVVLFWECEFVKNSASIGGCILNFAELTMDQCLLIENSAEAAGGAIVHEKSMNLNIKESSFRNNASKIGGAVATMGPVKVSNSKFEDNSSKNVGGAIEVGEIGKLKVINTSFHRNKSDDGGAIFTNSYDNLDNTDCEFRGNVPNDIN